MDDKTKLRLKSISRSRCSICNTPRSYMNPMAKCWECEKKFCFDHIYGLQINDKMALTDEVRDICEECKKKYNYH